MIRKKVQYTQRQFQDAYEDWSKELPMLAEERVNPERIRKWNVYCAIRDGLELNHYIELDRIESQKEMLWRH